MTFIYQIALVLHLYQKISIQNKYLIINKMQGREKQSLIIMTKDFFLQRFISRCPQHAQIHTNTPPHMPPINNCCSSNPIGQFCSWVMAMCFWPWAMTLSLQKETDDCRKPVQEDVLTEPAALPLASFDGKKQIKTGIN